jgi:hypothetical protein
LALNAENAEKSGNHPDDPQHPVHFDFENLILKVVNRDAGSAL